VRLQALQLQALRKTQTLEKHRTVSAWLFDPLEVGNFVPRRVTYETFNEKKVKSSTRRKSVVRCSINAT